jgi:TolB protein
MAFCRSLVMSRYNQAVVAIITGLSVLLLSIAMVSGCRSQDDPRPSSTLLYLSVVPSGESEVRELNWETGDDVQVVQLPGRVLSAASLVNEGHVIYPVMRADGGHDLWLVDLLRRRAQLWLACEPDDCPAVAPSPDGRGVVYARVTGGAPSLWWAQLASTDTSLMFQEAASPGHHPAWSPDGSRLAYVDPTGQVCIADLGGTSDVRCVLAMMEAAPVWSPDGSALLVTDMRLETGFANHILWVDVASGLFVDLSAAFGVEDDAPAWSPDGQWIAFRRQSAGTAMGKQIWLMRADGSDVRALTTDVASYHGPPIWMADGETLLTARYMADERGIWAISTVTGQATLVVPDGYLPHGLSDGSP